MTQRARQARKEPPIDDEATGRPRALGLYAALAECAAQPEGGDRLLRLCQAAVDLLAVTGVALTLRPRAPALWGGLITLHASDDVARRLADLQHATGEGPGLDATRLGHPVVEPDLATEGHGRWPCLTGTVDDTGVAALVSFPLQLDGATVGSLDGYRDAPGGLTDAELADGRALAALVLRELSHLSSADPSELDARIESLSRDRAVLEQATGMLAVQLATSSAEAAQRLRAYARDHRQGVLDVARHVVEGRLRLD